MTRFQLLIGCSLAYLMSGCVPLHPPAPDVDPLYAPTYPLTMDTKESRHINGSIYNPETALPLFETPRARHAGDLVTVILVEKTDAQKRATLRSRKNDKIQIAAPSFLGRPIALGAGYSLDFNINAQRQFDSDGQAIQNNKLAGNISVTVAKVLANGNMVIQGEKWIQIDQGKEFIRLSGIIRPQDIKPDNSISSDRVANARIYYGGTGQVNDTNAQGWIARFLWGPLFTY